MNNGYYTQLCIEWGRAGTHTSNVNELLIPHDTNDVMCIILLTNIFETFFYEEYNYFASLVVRVYHCEFMQVTDISAFRTKSVEYIGDVHAWLF